MLLNFPEYFDLSGYEQTFRHLFGYLNILFSLPVVFFSGLCYFVSARQNQIPESLFVINYFQRLYQDTETFAV
ncbi:MAG: copA 2 [Mucilaginibacter sp.]|nr:copA 2 [Mucilaginibacter sp.]